MKPEVVSGPTDPKLAHLGGPNLSRAWMLSGMARGPPASDPRATVLRAAATAHGDPGLRPVTGAHYEGGHWFALYLVTAEGTLAPLTRILAVFRGVTRNERDRSEWHPLVPATSIELAGLLGFTEFRIGGFIRG